MSRRHPLSSLGATGPPSMKQTSPISLNNAPASSSADDLGQARLLLLLGDLAGLLRSLLHRALRLLLRFLSHSALRCEMASFAACIRESKCTTFRIHQHLEKNRGPLKEALTRRHERACVASIDARARLASMNAKKSRVGGDENRKIRFNYSTFVNRISIDRCMRDAKLPR